MVLKRKSKVNKVLANKTFFKTQKEIDNINDNLKHFPVKVSEKLDDVMLDLKDKFGEKEEIV